jgi:hypothetical protein
MKKVYTVNESRINKYIIILVNAALALVVITSVVKGW